MGEWRTDMENAPRDGRPLWLAGHGVYHGVAFTGAYHPSPFKPDEPWVNLITKWRVPEHCLTHWMTVVSLPAPPEEPKP